MPLIRAGAVAALGAAGCAGAASDALRWRESWEIVALVEPGRAFDARVTVGHTGLLRGQGHLRLRRWGADALLFDRDIAPAALARAPDGRRVELDGDQLWQDADGAWSLRVRNPELSASLRVADGGGPRPPAATALTDGGQWTYGPVITQGRLEGWAEAGSRGGRLRGPALVLRRGGDGPAGGARVSLGLWSEEGVIGIDSYGDSRVGWARWGGVELDLRDLQLQLEADGSGALDLRPTEDLVVRWGPPAHGGAEDLRAPLSAPERLLARAAGAGAWRRVGVVQAEVHREGQPTPISGVLVRVSADAAGAGTPARRPR